MEDIKTTSSLNLKVNDTVFIRSPRINDARELFDLIDTNRDHLSKWLSWVNKSQTVEATKEFIHTCLQDYQAGKTIDGLMIIEHNKIIGTIGINVLDSKRNYNCEIGYWLSNEVIGRGIMTACVKRLLAYCFDDLTLHRVVIKAAKANVKSRAIPERLGFTLEGVLREDHFLHGKYVDGVIYSILSHEFKTN